MNFGPQMA